MVFDRIKRLFVAEQLDSYMNRVASALIEQGLKPSDLDAIQSVAALQRSGEIFRDLRQQKLSPDDAAQAIRLAVNLYLKTRHMAETSGWPLKHEDVIVKTVPRHEAYFLELLSEAASSVKFRPRAR
jgi:hypothetical protein